jgi:hypothetical protein
MTPAPDLAATQRLFWALITAPEGAAAALGAQAPDAERLRAAVEGQINGDARLSAVARLEIYADMYFYRLLDCLAEDFVAVRAVIGPERFHNLVTDYLLVHPSTHPSLRFAGRHLPEFLTTHDLLAEWPFLGDLARFEWALVDAFDAPNAEPLRATDLAAVPATEWDALRFRLVPSCRILDLQWAVADVWTGVKGGSDPKSANIGGAVNPNAVIVWRQALRVFHRGLSRGERIALGEISAGRTFGAVCARLAATESLESAASTMAGFLGRWIEDGLVTVEGP